MAEPSISRCRYWICSCGAVFEKDDLETKLPLMAGSGPVTVLGSRTCASCGKTYEMADIYAGRYDVPQEHWPQLESQHGKPVLVGGGGAAPTLSMGVSGSAVDKDEIYEKIRDALVEALGVDEDEVTPEAGLVGDLGAESIDFLDIVFRLEKAFDIKIPRGELFPEDVLTNPDYVQEGRVTEAGLAELRSRMPFANLDEFAKNPVVQDFGNLLTVADMCRFIESKVEVTG